ncbi:hypothetical protein ACP4OV_020194 [Aristida adscensionis]
MEELQEADILWPASDDSRSRISTHDVVVVTGGETAASTTVPPSVESIRPSRTSPVEISRRKRRCRPWPASEHHATFDQETEGRDEEEDGCTDDDAKMNTGGRRIVPPHVLAARRTISGRSRTAAYSMCAGKGRTLKGRDLRDVRNIVLEMTGFIEK